VNILLGVDTLTYHCRLEAGELTHEDIFAEVRDLGFSFAQLNGYHLRTFTESALAQLRASACALGLELTFSGDVLGRAGAEDSVASGVDRLARWIETARALGSPFVRVSSGFYRNELLRIPGAIAAEQRYVTDVLSAAADLGDADCNIVLENHSDFTPDEYMQIIESVGSDHVGVFLDLINPVTMLLDPLPVVIRLSPWASAGHVKDFKLVSDYVDDRFHRRGFDVQYCYPGEGVADLDTLVGALAGAERPGPYRLSIEGLDSRAGVADQHQRLAGALARLRSIL
jgi:sugar phosphate isomerase/epimerase